MRSTVPWDDLRLSQVEKSAQSCPDACAADAETLVAEVRYLHEVIATAIDDLERRDEDSALQGLKLALATTAGAAAAHEE